MCDSKESSVGDGSVENPKTRGRSRSLQTARPRDSLGMASLPSKG